VGHLLWLNPFFPLLVSQQRYDDTATLIMHNALITMFACVQLGKIVKLTDSNLFPHLYYEIVTITWLTAGCRWQVFFIKYRLAWSTTELSKQPTRILWTHYLKEIKNALFLSWAAFCHWLTWSSYLASFLSLRLVGAAGVRNYVRSSYSQWALSMDQNTESFDLMHGSHKDILLSP